MAISFGGDGDYEAKTLHNFLKRHYNYYQNEVVSNTDSFLIQLDMWYSQDNVKSICVEEDAKIFFSNITADVTCIKSDGTYQFFNGSVSAQERILSVTIPTQVSGKVFVRVSFDAYFYTIE